MKSENSTSNDTTGTLSSNEDSSNEALFEEMNQPWPATFQRSVSLLASPVISPYQADRFTRSPQPGAALLRRRAQRGGHLTPEENSLLSRIERAAASRSTFDKGLKKVQSLDYKTKYQAIHGQDLELAFEEQSKKSQSAKEYRQQFLKPEPPKTSKPPSKASPRKPLEEEQGPLVEKEPKATFSQCVFNMANILMGVGLLGLPFSFHMAGWGGGMFCLLILGLICWRTSILIGRTMNGDPRPLSCFFTSGDGVEPPLLPPIASFPGIAQAAFGEAGNITLSIVLYFELFSCLCIYIISIGDHMNTLVPALSTKVHVCIAAVVSIVPTVLLRTPRLLSYLSMVGTYSTIAIVVAVGACAILEGDMSHGDHITKQSHRQLLDDATKPTHTFWNTSGIPMALGLVAYCFSGHALVPSIYTSMARPQQFERMMDVTFLIVVVASLAVGCSGYYMFGNSVLDQVTLSLKKHSKAVLAMKILTGLIVTTSFSKNVLTMYPLALGMEEVVAPYLSTDRLMQLASSTIKLILTIMSLIVSLYVPSFSFICALVGLICTMAVSVIFPAAAHLKLFYHHLSWTERVLDSIFVGVGFIVAIVGTIATVGSGA